MDTIYHATVRLVRNLQFVGEFDGARGAPMLFDEPRPLGDGTAPNAAAVLGAAVGNCLAASLAFCLRRARLDPTRLTAQVSTHVARNDHGRLRISGIDVELLPELAADDADAGLDRCERVFEDFCTVTTSVRQGIPVHVSVARPATVGEHRAGVRTKPGEEP